MEVVRGGRTGRDRLNSSVRNWCLSSLDDGSRVGRGERVASFSSVIPGINGKTESLREEIEELKAQLEKLRQALMGFHGASVLLIFVEEFVYKFWNILGFYSFVVRIEYSGFVVVVCS